MNTAPAPRVLVIEDEPDLRDATVTFLNLEGLIADGVGSLAAADSWLLTHNVDMLVLDLGLPDGNGLQWLQQQASWRDKGVVITTARGHEQDRIDGVRGGADVYLVKPVALEELTSLLYNLWRRLRGQVDNRWFLQPVGWVLHPPMGQAVRLTHSELLVLQRLASQPGQAVTRQDLAEALGHDPDVYDYRRMEVLIRRLRNKVQETSGMNLPLETVHRMGYALVAPMQVL
jgi:DNA-binding response OmpR family regulator